jgi:two-component system, cell cycle response regulator DivK
MKEKVLIIDDDSKNIFALTATLKTRKLDTVSAHGAREGIDLLQSDPGIRVVLLDMMMPGMDGYEAIKEIRSDVRYRHLPVIAVTAQAMAGDKEKCLAAGADHYIPKPIDVDALMQLLNACIKTG